MNGIGSSPPRPDGGAKVTGAFAYASDLRTNGMLWGATLRSPYPRAVILAVDASAALALPGVHAVLTHQDVPGRKHYGLELTWDQPVLATGEVRYYGEPVALVAAETAAIAKRALALIHVGWKVQDAVLDARAVLDDPDGLRVQERGGIVRHQPIRLGDVAEARRGAEVVVSGRFRVGIQDPAFLGPESVLAVPAADGGIDLQVATQWLHNDLAQVAPCLGLPAELVRMSMAGVGGAFGGRQDLSAQIHAAMLALRTGKPVKMVYDRTESFLGHPHRHPADMHYTYGATTDGRLLFAEADILLDGGAYASATANVVANAASLALGPYEIPHVRIDAYGVYTNNPPCGAMRGFGAVQTCFAHESMLDRLAAACGLDPITIRIRNAGRPGSRLPTGQLIGSAASLSELMERLIARPLPDPGSTYETPGGRYGSSLGEGIVRGVGYGVGLKNICFSEGFDDYSTARVVVSAADGESTALVHTAAAEVGQGVVTLQEQIVRTELGVTRVRSLPASLGIGDAGSSSASRQSYMTGGAVKAACEAVRERLVTLASERFGDSTWSDGRIITSSGDVIALHVLLGDLVIDETHEFHHHPTEPMAPDTGRGDTHVQLALCVHRAVVDVDIDLGLVRVVELAAVQDVGRALNPTALEGQIHGGAAQALGLALLEELQIRAGVPRNASLAGYLLPTTLDVPPMPVELVENPDPRAPYGLRGAGEPPTLSATPAIVAALRSATGLALTNIPVTPEDLISQPMA